MKSFNTVIICIVVLMMVAVCSTVSHSRIAWNPTENQPFGNYILIQEKTATLVFSDKDVESMILQSPLCDPDSKTVTFNPSPNYQVVIWKQEKVFPIASVYYREDTNLEYSKEDRVFDIPIYQVSAQGTERIFSCNK